MRQGKFTQKSERNFETKMAAGYDKGIFSKFRRVYMIILAAKNEIVMILEFKKSGGVYKKEKGEK